MIKHSALKYLVILAGIIGVFFFFRQFIKVGDYTQEISAAFLGGVITVVITGFLLQKQTEVELSKERNVEILRQKLSVYGEMLKNLEEVIRGGSVGEADKIKMHLHFQRLIQIAPLEVLKSFHEFLEKYRKAGADGEIKDEEIDVLLEKLRKVNLCIRIDIASPEEREGPEQRKELEDLTAKSLEVLSGKVTREDFLANCNDFDKAYFTRLFAYMDTRTGDLKIKYGVAGFSINGAVLCYPSASRRRNSNIEFRTAELSAAQKTLLDLPQESAKQSVYFSTQTLKVERLIEALKA